MTRVDFYLLEEETDRDRVACRLVDKAYRLGHRVYLAAHDDTHADRLNDLLWTFQAGSFVPHQRVGDAGADQCPVLIGVGEPPPGTEQVLVTLQPEVPAFFARFERVAEIVGPDPPEKDRSRDRFRFYRDRGYALEVHHL